MPGQKQKGKNNVKKSKVRYEFIEPTKNQLIAIIEDTHGGYPPRFGCKTIEGDKIIAPIQGSISKGPKRVLVKKGDYVLLEPIEFEKGKYFIHHVYQKDDNRLLQKKGYLDNKVKDESNVIFGEAVEESIEVGELNIDEI